MFEPERMPAIAELPARFIKPTEGRPLIWVLRVKGAAYLINASDEVLNLVEATSGGFVTSDLGTHSVESDAVTRYQDVHPGEAVKIEEYDEYYDLDYVLQIQLQIESPSLGQREFLTEPGKGGVRTQVLLRGEADSAGRGSAHGGR